MMTIKDIILRQLLTCLSLFFYIPILIEPCSFCQDIFGVLKGFLVARFKPAEDPYLRHAGAGRALEGLCLQEGSNHVYLRVCPIKPLDVKNLPAVFGLHLLPISHVV